ncbi:g10973 [Coccomyxa viridis]|uniref:G10973 protein n=1 Tax=Coccomyxa viridis TaxID=1274662 RepID=A0ABP1G6T8_9CHLO
MTATPSTMRSIVFDEPGVESVLHVGNAALPELGSNDVCIKIEAAGVNRADLEQRLGKYSPPPGHSPNLGLEAAGTVMEAGSDAASRSKAGERVMALCPGGAYAEQVVVDTGSVLPVPSNWSTYEAAGFMETTLTAFLNIFQIGGAVKGKSVLVHGGGSGIGTQAIALCKAKGITTFVTAGSDEKCDQCAQRGADNVINYKTEDFAEVVNGRTKAPRSKAFKADLVASLAETFKAELKQGSIKPDIYKVLPWESAADAHRCMASSTHFGKILLSMKAT